MILMAEVTGICYNTILSVGICVEIDTSSCRRLDTEIETGVKTKAEGDHSASSGSSMHESQVIGYGRDVQRRLIPHTRAHAHEAVNAHYPRRTQADIVSPGSVTRTGVQSLATSTPTSLDTSTNTDIGSGVAELRQVLGLASVSRAGSGPAEFTEAAAFDQVSSITIASGLSSFATSTAVTVPYGLLSGVVSKSVATFEDVTVETTIAPTPMPSSPQQTGPQSDPPMIWIIAVSAIGGIALIATVTFTVCCVLRRRAHRRSRCDSNSKMADDNGNRDPISSSGPGSDWQVDFGTHEDDARIGGTISTSPAPPSTVPVPLSTSTVPLVPVSNVFSPSLPIPTAIPESSPGVPIPTSSTNSYPGLGSYPDPNQYPDPYPYLQHPRHRHHSDCYSEHEPGTPCPAYSCISLRENNYTIRPASLRSVPSNNSRWHGRDGGEGSGSRSEGESGNRSDGGEGRTRVGSRSRSRSRTVARRTNVPLRSMTRATARTWMTTSERSGETPPPSYDLASRPPPVHQ
ncbi:hypothetical protein BJ138DRAFT_1105565 [Hygrophoropsis aurantiaca]|uniref:Uncharacterized protein n=1 Tax=Hygrophoropsis aurantiaca TaxID=72124 RepID=A0ACB7ZYI9_9AGAM|nr:hypothetical protein BJ138DRAFT_1105565 [Hygrophoropsis aurantiaca]